MIYAVNACINFAILVLTSVYSIFIIHKLKSRNENPLTKFSASAKITASIVLIISAFVLVVVFVLDFFNFTTLFFLCLIAAIGIPAVMLFIFYPLSTILTSKKIKIPGLGQVFIANTVGFFISAAIIAVFLVYRKNEFIIMFVVCSICCYFISNLNFASTLSLFVFVSVFSIYELIQYNLTPSKHLCSIACEWDTYPPVLPTSLYLSIQGTSAFSITSVIVTGAVLAHFRKLDEKLNGRFLIKGYVGLCVAFAAGLSLAMYTNHGLPFLPFSAVMLLIVLVLENVSLRKRGKVHKTLDKVETNKLVTEAEMDPISIEIEVQSDVEVEDDISEISKHR
ncbi:hypothetical protein PCE1_004344 [Barthelona sp. PCE]